MGLYTGKQHTFGERQKFFAMAEATPGTFVKAATASAATDGAMRVISSTFKADYPINYRKDSYASSRDLTSGIVQQGDLSWEVNMYMTPSNDITGTPDSPSCGRFIAAAMRTAEAKTTDTKIVYALSSSQSMTGSTLSLTRNFQDLWQESMWGCVPDEMTIDAQNGKEPRIKFAGPAIGGYAFTGKIAAPALSGDEAKSQTVLSVTAATEHNIMVGSVIQLYDGTDTDSDLKVTAVDRTNHTITVTPAIANDQAGTTSVITPYVPAFSEYASDGYPICNLAGSLTLMGTSITDVLSFNLTLKNNGEKIESAFSEINASDISESFRDITGKISCKMREDYISTFAKKNLRKEGFSSVTGALVVVFGPGPLVYDATKNYGQTWHISCPYVELEFLGDVGVPENGSIPCEFSFRALGSSGNDALVITMGNFT